MENFWTIGFRKIINKRSKGLWVFIREPGQKEKEIKFCQVKDPKIISLKFSDYEIAYTSLKVIRDYSTGRRKEYFKLGNGKLIYVKINSKG